MEPRTVTMTHRMRITQDAQKCPLLMLGFFTTRYISGGLHAHSPESHHAAPTRTGMLGTWQRQGTSRIHEVAAARPFGGNEAHDDPLRKGVACEWGSALHNLQMHY